jgi:eukaryotic-like serine/threonine-protein kinase
MPDARSQLQSSLGDDYTVERELGGGGMSRVYLVEDTRLHRRIVVKVLPPEMAAEVSVMRFSREIALAARLQHPHIVPLLDTGETDGLPYYSMPFVDGETLRQRLARGGELPIVEAVRLLREIASALAYAHDKGLVHRDIKPENVLLSGGVALVADFGVAKALLASTASGTEALTSVGVAIGTPAYMSPEQVAADPAVDHRADLYSFGMIAYEMLAGQAPFAGRPPQALLAAHLTGVPEPLQQRRPATPPALADLVMRCLEKRPADRPQNANEIVQVLDSLSTSSQTPVQLPRQRRTTRFTVIAALVLVALSGLGAWWRFGHRPPLGRAASRLLIAPFENLTGDPRFDYVGRIAADGLAISVGQAGVIDVVPSNTVLMSLRDTTGGVAKRLERLAAATHAGLIASGTVLRRGDSLVLQAQVTDVKRNKVVATLDPISGPASDPVAIVTSLGDRLLGALGGRQIAILPQGNHAPKNAAYQEFARGFERFAVYTDNLGSRPFFERAIALDSTYVRAYQLLARQYLNAGEFDRADSMGRRIERLPGGLNAVERFTLDYMNAELRGDVPGLLRSQQQLVALDSSPLALALAGEAAIYLLRPELAVPALERAVPAFDLVGGGAASRQAYLLGEAYHEAGDHAAELRTLAAHRAFFPDVGLFRLLELRAYAGQRDKSSALALADSMLLATSDSAGILLTRMTTGAQEFRAHGDTATASRLLSLTRAWLATHPDARASPRRQLAAGVLFLMSGLPDSAIAHLTPAAHDLKRIDASGQLALAQAARGDRAHALASADSIGAITRPWLFGNHTFWRAAIVGALGDRDQAMQLLAQSHREGQYMDTWHYSPALAALRGYGPFDALVRAR